MMEEGTSKMSEEEVQLEKLPCEPEEGNEGHNQEAEMPLKGGKEAPIEEEGGTENPKTIDGMVDKGKLDQSETMKASESVDPPQSVETSEVLESSGNMDKELSLDKDSEMDNDNAFEDESIFKGDSEIEAVTHTEIDLTAELETQRLTGMCRVCANSKIKLVRVFGTGKNIMEKIHSFLPILVTPDDLLPVKICIRCLASLDRSQKLVETCLAADKKLRDLLEKQMSASANLELKTERVDVDDDYDNYNVGCDDDEPDRPPTPFTPLSADTNFPLEAVSPKREVVTPEPIPPRNSRTRTAGSGPASAKANSESGSRRTELERLTGDLKDTPNILKRRRTRQTSQENLSPTILEKIRSYGIKESSVVMTKVDIPQDSSSAVVTTVSVPTAKEKPKSRMGPKRLYRCLYCNETGSDAYKLLLHQMKMHPGNLLKCPHCGFVCGSDQKAKFDAHVLAHDKREKSQPVKKVPELVAIGSQQAGPVRHERTLLPRPTPIQHLVSLPPAKRAAESNSKSLLKGSAASPSKKLAKAPPVQIATPVMAQIPGSAIMLRIQVDGKPGANGAPPAPTALVPVTLYQCARCRLNFNTKEAVEKHMCVIPSNMIPIAMKPGEPISIALKPGEPIPIALKPREPVPIALKPREPVPIALKPREPIPIALKPREPVPIALKPRESVPIALKPGEPIPVVLHPKDIPMAVKKQGDPIAIAPKPTEAIALKAGEPIPIAPKPGDVEFTCTTCGIHFADAALLREHVLTHYQTYKCDLCGSAFRSEFHLRQHMKRHNSEKREYPCSQCPKVYTVKSRLKVHLHSHSNTPRCVCPQCGKVFRTDGGYRNHIKAHENKRAFACSVCGLRFNRRGNMLRHERNCDGKKSLTCKFCTESFAQKDDLLIHRSSVHPELEFSVAAESSTGDKEKRYACKVCSEGFVRVMELRRHQLMHSEEELNAVKNVADGGAYLCHTCGKQLHHLHNYKLHIMHHQGKALFKCDQCDRSFTSKFALKYHHMLHTGDFPYKCSLCPESFRTSVALQVHRYKHTGDKPYRCKLCEMGFFTRHSLRLHQIVHSNERNYVCRVCGSTFKRRKTLRYHSLIHTGEKPHTCRICGKSFRQKGTCTIHERNHDLMAKRKPNPATGRRLRSHAHSRTESEEEEAEQMENVVEEAEESLEDERAAQMVQMEVEETVEQEAPSQPPRVWRIADPKVQYRLKSVDWKQAATSHENEAVYVIREAEGMKEGLPEVCSVQSEVIAGEFLSMYPDMQIHDAEIVEGEKTSIEFTTADGTIRILR